MKTTRLSSSELRSLSLATLSLKPKRGKAGALRSVETDRGLHNPHGNQVVMKDWVGSIIAIGFAFMAFSVGTFFLILSLPTIWTSVVRLWRLL